MANDLTPIDAVRRQLAEISSIDDATNVRDMAEAIRHMATIANDRDLEISAAEIKIRAERRVGQMLMAMERHRGGRPRQTGSPLHRFSPATLADLGVDKKLSVRGQRYAAMSDAEFEAAVAQGKDEMRRRDARSLAAFFKHVARPGAARTPPLPEGRYRVIYADPPWEHVTWSSAGMDRSPANHYSTMPTAEICALPIDYIAADDCALFIWVYGPRLPDALKVIEHWGFAYKSIGFVWAKSNGEPEAAPIGQGHWTRAQSEICLLATRGAPRRLDKGVRQIIAAPRGAHSVKPEEAYGRIERLLAGPYIELFARQTRPGWDAWGAEVPAS
jgi:N6-adenosine-specific RNA methylase IME4